MNERTVRVFYENTTKYSYMKRKERNTRSVRTQNNKRTENKSCKKKKKTNDVWKKVTKYF
jgi:hypothetical protein